MKLTANSDINTTHRIISNYNDEYNIINNSKINDELYFIVVEKFFFRNSSRASLSIVLAPSSDGFSTLIEAVGSGGGQGMIFKFDWGAKESFENAIPKLLTQHNISFTTTK